MNVITELYSLYEGDCTDTLPTLADSSIDLIIEDGPYHKVKGEDWDNRHKTVDEFIAWKRTILEQYQRILKPNGSLYVFASPQMAWHVEGVVRERFNVLNRIVWAKHDGSGYGTGSHSKIDEETLRSYFPQTEHIIFAEQGDSDTTADDLTGFSAAEIALKKEIFGDYLATEFKRAGVSNHQITGAIGAYRKVNHGGAATNWQLGYNIPTPLQYQAIRDYLNNLNCAQYLETDYGVLQKRYELARTTTDEQRQQYYELRRPFNATPDAPYTDVWTFPTVMNYPGKHVCEKPLVLMEHIIRLSSKPGATVLDCFMGSGATGHACVDLDRKFIGIEQSEQWFCAAERRIIDAHRIAQGLPKQLRGKASDTADMPLFAAIGD